IAMLIALNREAELKMHLRASFNNAGTRVELRELILHSSLYYGLPASNSTMHLAQPVFYLSLIHISAPTRPYKSSFSVSYIKQK
ncbi:carboxymuconolactone decarboxylase family protein, partial [Escherichia coli]|nr:carboxymuconolactone decarboxylase family protein [Escherichia coli]